MPECGLVLDVGEDGVGVHGWLIWAGIMMNGGVYLLILITSCSGWPIWAGRHCGGFTTRVRIRRYYLQRCVLFRARGGGFTIRRQDAAWSS